MPEVAGQREAPGNAVNFQKSSAKLDVISKAFGIYKGGDLLYWDLMNLMWK
jgi:hypothetical protein